MRGGGWLGARGCVGDRINVEGKRHGRLLVRLLRHNFYRFRPLEAPARIPSAIDCRFPSGLALVRVAR